MPGRLEGYQKSCFQDLYDPGYQLDVGIDQKLQYLSEGVRSIHGDTLRLVTSSVSISVNSLIQRVEMREFGHRSSLSRSENLKKMNPGILKQ